MNKKISQSEINKRIKQVTAEAEFRFKCLELATPFSKKISELIENATSIYNYAFHINPEALKKAKENADSSK
tara:strand:- start:1480 stop:1695 length:216 start_codon:yes stop_codon:yes gene_type:complete